MKKGLFILSLLILVLATAVLISAQTGGGFDLSWSTVDGGGGDSSGGPFALSGTIGQPDAGNLSGGDFTLNGGFWQCATAAVTAPGIATSTGDIDLNWTGGTANVYRAVNDPYFDPGAAYALGVSSIWTDPGAAGDTASNHTYIIRAVGNCGESANSQRLGEFDFALVSGS